MGQVQLDDLLKSRPGSLIKTTNLNYCGELKRAMEIIAANPRAIFIGQGVGSPSTSQTDSFRDIDPQRRIEFPVAEDLQMGFAIGLALDGWLPVCVYPRWNFLLLAANQLINHLDKIDKYSAGGFQPKVIIRVMAPSIHPFDPGPQHQDDFTRAFELMLDHIRIQCLDYAHSIVPYYEQALVSPVSTIMVEYASHYDKIPSGVMG